MFLAYTIYLSQIFSKFMLQAKKFIFLLLYKFLNEIL